MRFIGTKMTVIDFFCGAGGFSEGFKQMGYEIIYGYDYWKPAVDTFNFNFNLNCEIKNILDFKHSIDEIESLPNTDIIIGSPPCVSFSSSNKSGKADKSLGVELIEIFLKIIAVKKYQSNSILKAWFMENVVNSKKYLKTIYTFEDLGLTEWAIKNRIIPTDVAINLDDNSIVINSADYGSFQARKRIISGEIVKKGKLIVPHKTHSKEGSDDKQKHLTVGKMKENFPHPYSKPLDEKICDPQYDLKVSQTVLTDHFYDTGIYQVEWRFSKYWKTNHPYMGRMSFPENENKPSRTITATKIANSRESIIYKSEFNRTGDGEYRLPTVREAAIIMGFPITYQFIGASENTKWRLVGNAVCCAVSRAFAETTLQILELSKPNKLIVNKIPKLEGVFNLNTYEFKEFNNPPVKNKGARFRRHPIKDGNLTVTLSNYDIGKNSKTKNKWFTSIQYGTGKGFPIQKVEDEFYKELRPLIESFKGGKKFLEIINNGFSKKIGNKTQLQDMYEKQASKESFMEPTLLVDEVASIIEKVNCLNSIFEQKEIIVFENKEKIPVKQLFALYAINKISTIANNK